MTDQDFMKKDRAPLTQKQTILFWAGIALGIIVLSVAAFFITKAVTAPAPIVVEDPDRIPQDDVQEEVNKVLSELSKPGERIPEGEEGRATLSTDVATNRPVVGSISLDSVQEVDPMNIGNLKLDAPVLGEDNARVWYVTATVTVDERPSDKTGIYFPFALSNDATPADDNNGLVFAHDNPDCMYGPRAWSEVEGNSATMCRVLITFDSEPVEDVLLIFSGFDYSENVEYGENPPRFEFTARDIEG